MDLQKIDDIKKTITFLLENGEFADIETAYNISMNALNDIDELYKQDQVLQLQQTGVNGSFFKCTCLRPQTNCFSGKCSYCNNTIQKDITTDDL